MNKRVRKLHFSQVLPILILFFITPQSLKEAWAQVESSKGSFAYLVTYDQTDWQFAPDPPFHISSFSGNIDKGLVVFGGFGNKQVAFTKDLANGRWEIVVDAPFPVHQSAGSNIFGPIICGGDDNRQVSYMRNYRDNVWKTVAITPFVVSDISGTNEYGPIIVGGPNRRKLAFLRSFSENKWITIADAPFPVTALTGDNAGGVIIAGGDNNRQMAYMTKYSTNKWNMIANAPFSIIDIAGNNTTGPVVVGGEDNKQVAYMSKYSENRWRIVENAPIRGSEISGSNDGGIIVCKIDQKSRFIVDASGGSGGKTRENKIKTAVVEFQERGDLGMRDAGTIIAEWLTTALNKTGGFEVYERLSLSSLMEEHKLSGSGLMDEQTAAEIGRIRGVEAIVTGSVSKLGDVYSVTAKVIDVTTAKIITSSDIKVNDVNAIVAEIDKLAWELAKE